MALDIAGIIIIAFFFIRGFSKGAILAVFSVAAFLLGILCSLKLSQAFSAWLLEKGYVTSGWVQVISYAMLFIIVVLIVRLIGSIIQKVAEGLMLGLVNRLIGGVLYAFLGAVLWSSLLWIATRMNIITPALIAASKTYSWLTGLAPWFFELAGKLIPFVKDTFVNLDHFFDTINNKLPGHVGTH